MDIIRAGYDQLIRAPTKTITFTGGAGAGAVGNVTVWTISGRVLLVSMPPAFCTTLLTESGPTATVSLGTTTSTALIIAPTNSTLIDANEWWDSETDGAIIEGSGVELLGAGGLTSGLAISQNIVITCAVTNTNAGVLVFDGCWYRPLTSGASLT